MFFSKSLLICIWLLQALKIKINIKIVKIIFFIFLKLIYLIKQKSFKIISYVPYEAGVFIPYKTE
jgi:hypothetical protein